MSVRRGGRGAGRRARAARVARVAAAATLAAAGCAKKAPPSGGPPDLDPPRVVSTQPDSGAAGVARSTELAITFSEGMEPRATGEAVSLAPRLEIRQRRWSGRTLTLVPAESLQADQTYILSVGGTARDRHGNAMGTGATVPFTTAATFPSGGLEGVVESRGFEAAGTYLWVYDAAAGGVPDSTARDFDALGIADEKGRFEVLGLAAPGRYRVWGFADLNRNRSFEPSADVLTAADTLITLTAGEPMRRGLRLRMVNPRAPARVEGAVLDTLGDSLGVVRILARSESDTARRVLVEVSGQGGFGMPLEAGRWRLTAFRDLDRNRAPDPAREPASEALGLELEPAAEVRELVLVLRRPAGVPSTP
jgi:hypothetical protein